MNNIKNPVILFIPVSSTEGIGEYSRSLILAEEVKIQIPQADIHFVLNENVSYGHTCPFTVHYSKHSATKDTPKVKEVLYEIVPDLVIFDCAGRAEQFAYAKQLGAKIIFMSQHKKKRARGLKNNRIFNTDIHWVVQPNYAIEPLSYYEKLKLKLFSINKPKNIGPILAKVTEEYSHAVLNKFNLIKNEFILFSAGSGGHRVDDKLAADSYFLAAKDYFIENKRLKCVMIFGDNYPSSLPKNSDVLCLRSLPNKEFISLMKNSKACVVSAGDTLLQAINLHKPCVASAVCKDQFKRLKACEKQKIVISSRVDSNDIKTKLFHLLENDHKSILKSLGEIETNDGINIAIKDIKESLNLGTKRYLFFISQNYSFPILRPLQEEIIKQGGEVKWFLYGKEINFNYLEKDEYVVANVDEIMLYNPHAVFVPGNVVPSFIPGLKIQVFHGLPGKKTRNNGQIYHYIIRGMFDLYCTQGSSSTSKFKELQKKHQHFNVKETGWCKLDPLFKDQNINKNIREQKKTIFLASTFSPRFSRAKLLYPLVKKMMKKHDINWFITLHPKMSNDVVKLYKSIDLPNVKYVETTELIDYLKLADLMLCDTSAIIYEFMVQIKPVITFQTEKEEAYLINIEDLESLESTILKTLNTLDHNKEKLYKATQIFHPYTDGCSSERVLLEVNKMLLGCNMPKKKKPLNIIRNLKLRKELNYWF